MANKQILTIGNNMCPNLMIYSLHLHSVSNFILLPNHAGMMAGDIKKGKVYSKGGGLY